MFSFSKKFLTAAALMSLGLTSAYAKPNSTHATSASQYVTFNGYQNAKFGMTTDDFKNALKCSAFLDWTYTPAVPSSGEEADDHTTSVKCEAFNFLDTKISAIGSFYDDHLTDVYLTDIPSSLVPEVKRLLADKYGVSVGSKKDFYDFTAPNGNKIVFANKNGKNTLLYAQSSRSRPVVNKRLSSLKMDEKDI